MLVISITALGVALFATILLAFWPMVLKFFNGPIRNLLERILGQDKVSWYVKFLMWLDNKSCSAIRNIESLWQKFKNTVLRVKAIYTKNADGSYTKNTETILRNSPTTVTRTVHEEILSWEYLPDEVRNEMSRQRVDTAECDEREFVNQKARQRASEECIDMAF